MRDAFALCYHGVSEDWPNPYSLPPSELAAQMQMVLRRGYEPTGFSQMVAGRGPRKAVAVTFDDAHRSVYEQARPLLEELGVRGTVFVPTAPVSEGRPLLFEGYERWLGSEWGQELTPMTWDHLRELADDGWEIGSHTRTHPRLTQLGDAELAKELRVSREEIEDRLGRPCPALAYPYGDVDDRVAAAARAAGYAAAAALGGVAPGRLTWPRHMVMRHQSPAYFRRQVSPLLRRMRRSPLWPLLHGVLRPGKRSPGPRFGA